MNRLVTQSVNEPRRLPSLKLPEDSKWVVWWYGALIKKARRGEQPGVAVFFRALNRDDTISGNDSNLLIVFYVQIMPDDFVMQLHRF